MCEKKKKKKKAATVSDSQGPEPRGSTSSRAAATAVELQLLFPLMRVNCALGEIMVIACSCVKLLSAHNSPQHTTRKHKVKSLGWPNEWTNLPLIGVAPPCRLFSRGKPVLPPGIYETRPTPGGKGGFGYWGGLFPPFPPLTEISWAPGLLFGVGGKGGIPPLPPQRGGVISGFFLPPKKLGGGK
eukprot:FR741270.1.p1 GENE.FR741270.1~~FR741270.1.p1  ORF type:complete len:185 (+),score=62.34 FR741270.1:593-1147(+)